MKNILSLAILLMTIVFFSCEKDTSRPGKTTGKIHIDIGAVINVQEMDGGLKTIPSVDDFTVIIYNADSSPAMTFNRAIDMPDTVELAIGDYYVKAFSDNNLPAEFENPYYFGESQAFTVSSNMHLSVEVNCVLSNTIVSVIYSENIISSFLDYSTTVASELGSLVFLKTETRKGYFETSPLDITVELDYLKPDGTPVNRIIAGSIPSPLPNKHYQISVDASISEGMASFQILRDTTEVLMELVEITDNQDSLPDGLVSYGDLLITEIMYDPTALSDTEGEYFEIYNNSGQEINLQNLILKRDDTNWHIINDSIVLLPGEYFVFARAGQASDAANSYIYGSAISLSNTGAVLSIYNEGTETEPGALIFSVNYGESGFPGGSGASISLNPDLMNAADAVLGTSWCTSTSSFNTGDLGTPGAANDNCN